MGKHNTNEITTCGASTLPRVQHEVGGWFVHLQSLPFSKQ